jgi:hypothetical protein
MKGKEIAILIFIIVVLVFYIYSEKGEKTHYEMPDMAKIEADEISKLQIKKKDSEIVLVRDGGKWFVGTEKFPADSSIVSGILKKVSGVSLTALASESKNYSIYELDDDKRIDVEAYKSGDVVRKIGVGKTASSYRHTFVMIDSDYRVFHATGNLKSDFNKSLSDLRDKNVMSIEEEITGLMLNKGNEALTLVKTSEPVSVDITEKKEEQAVAEEPKWTTSDGKDVKAEEVDGLIKNLSSLSCNEFIEGKTKADFHSPVFTVTLSGINTYTVSIFEKKDNQYPAVTSQSDYPCLIAEFKADSIMKNFGSLVEE